MSVYKNKIRVTVTLGWKHANKAKEKVSVSVKGRASESLSKHTNYIA